MPLNDLLKPGNATFSAFYGSVEALNAALAALPAWAEGDRQRHLGLQAGDFTVSAPIELPSGVILDLTRGVKITLANAANCDIITNADWAAGNSDITILGGFLDGNRTNQATPAAIPEPGQSLITLCNVERAVVKGVRGKSPALHGLDLTNTLYSTQGAEPGCVDFLVDDCVFSDFGDDGITTHMSHGGVISNCGAYDSAGSYSGDTNAFEIDDGSSDIAIVGGWARNCNKAVHIKAHANNDGARRVTVSGVVATDCNIAFNVGAETPYHANGAPEQVTYTDCIAQSCTAGISAIHYGSVEFIGCLFNDCTNLFSSTDPTDATATAVIKMTACQIHNTTSTLDNTNIVSQVYSGCVWRGDGGTSLVTVSGPDITFTDCTMVDGVSNFTGALHITASGVRCKVKGGRYVNSNGAGIRISGAEDVVIDGATISGGVTAGGLYIPATATAIVGLRVTNCVAVGGTIGFNLDNDAEGDSALISGNVVGGSSDAINGTPTGFIIRDNIEDDKHIPGQVPGVPPAAVNDYLHPAAVARSSSTFTKDRLHYIPLWVPETMTINQIGCELVTAAGATGVMRLGIYRHDPSDHRPGALVVDAGTVDGSATTGAKTITINVSLTAGLYWLAAAAQGADAASPSWRGLQGPMFGLPITSTPTGASQSNAHIQGAVSGALPDPSGAAGASITTVSPLVFVRRGA